MSQSTRILAVLADGKPHSTAELYRRVGGMILHSRVAELRKRGYRISCEYVGGSGAEAYVYTLEDSAAGPNGSLPTFPVEEGQVTVVGTPKPIPAAEQLRIVA